MKLWISLCLSLFVTVFIPSQYVSAELKNTSSTITYHSASSSHTIPLNTWSHQQQLTSMGWDAIDFIQSATNHGLNPEDYAFSELNVLLNDLPHSAEQFHLKITHALLSLIHDLAIGRHEPSHVDPTWFIPRDSVDAESLLQHALLTGHLKASLNQIAPDIPEYHQLMSALSLYRTYQSRGGWKKVPESELLKPGHHHSVIPDLRVRLAIEDATLLSNVEDPELFDEHLATAVRRFQQQNNLKIDGIIGNETRAALNISASERVQQIALNLERLRWLPKNMGDRYVLVNVASYQLKAVEMGNTTLNMRVIVGKQKRPTPSFKSEMTHIVFNPYWNVPNKLARLDILPKQKSNPDYLFLNKFRIFLKSDPSQEIDPYRVDWNEVDSRQFPFRLQQLPGEANALGQMKFMFPNDWNIYLHDTPDPTLFDRHQRNFSSGCIRVEHPLALAEFSLNEADSLAWVQQQIDSRENRGRKLKEPIPIYAVYFTVWPNEHGVSFSPDPYKRDHVLAKYL